MVAASARPSSGLVILSETRGLACKAVSEVERLLISSPLLQSDIKLLSRITR